MYSRHLPLFYYIPLQNNLNIFFKTFSKTRSEFIFIILNSIFSYLPHYSCRNRNRYFAVPCLSQGLQMARQMAPHLSLLNYRVSQAPQNSLYTKVYNSAEVHSNYSKLYGRSEEGPLQAACNICKMSYLISDSVAPGIVSSFFVVPSFPQLMAPDELQSEIKTAL